jgi:hypothetical protein
MRGYKREGRRGGMPFSLKVPTGNLTSLLVRANYLLGSQTDIQQKQKKGRPLWGYL